MSCILNITQTTGNVQRNRRTMNQPLSHNFGESNSIWHY